MVQDNSIVAERSVQTVAEQDIQTLSLYATAAVLMDADSGRVLYEKNGSSPLAMASTTKIMTCILVLENGDLDDTAEVSAYAASMPKVKMNVSKGEAYEVRNLLFSLMLESHNDSAVVLAEYIGRTYQPDKLQEKSVTEFTAEESRQAVKAFANLMNEKARELGCENTWFITPNGLDATETFETDHGTIQREHVTTASELARIMAYCIGESPAQEQFRQITAQESYSFYENGRSVACVNHNAFLHMMDGAFSGKTGFTNKAGYCYVGALEDSGRTFVVALLGCGWPNNKTYKWSDTRELMEFGLENYEKREVGGGESAFDEARLKPIPVENGQNAYLGGLTRVGVEILERHDEEAGQANVHPKLLMREDEKVTVDFDMKRMLKAPVEPGTRVGTIRYSVDGKTWLTETIVTCEGVKEVNLPWCLEQVVKRFFVL
ncbi:MAG: D-alanyl-D-alanine carboxypeptidase [Lachnospiraceae bacterium]|nr:D-alanyl-D-alanine carboxypeptidase [Lachnospiraceae bacterium]